MCNWYYVRQIVPQNEDVTHTIEVLLIKIFTNMVKFYANMT
jgi:hypothetical protein